MKVTQAMIDAFGETLERVPRREIEEGIQAVLDLIEQERPDVEPFAFSGHPNLHIYLHPACGTVVDVDPAYNGIKHAARCVCSPGAGASPWKRIYVERAK